MRILDFQSHVLNIQGRVYVRFIVNKDGKVENISIGRGVDPHLDSIARWVVPGKPGWITGESQGKKVNAS
ncbi:MULTISPECIES: energy transducer TonB [unclassified Saccharicrinis]|uniref:energy transducer TonB n=1 Tax=unclassified Saccharicrinis TaxID=2646859 RepID=UPI003D349B3E